MVAAKIPWEAVAGFRDLGGRSERIRHNHVASPPALVIGTPVLIVNHSSVTDGAIAGRQVGDDHFLMPAAG